MQRQEGDGMGSRARSDRGLRRPFQFLEQLDSIDMFKYLFGYSLIGWVKRD
jgi:hypothetical protein